MTRFFALRLELDIFPFIAAVIDLDRLGLRLRPWRGCSISTSDSEASWPSVVPVMAVCWLSTAYGSREVGELRSVKASRV